MPTPFLIGGLETRIVDPIAAPPSPEALQALIESAEGRLPPEYEDAIRRHDGFQLIIGDGDETAYASFFPCEAVMARNKDFELKERGSSLFAVGGDGGGEAFAFDLSNGEWAIVNWVDIGSGEFEIRFPSLRSLLEALANGTAFDGPST